MQCELKVTECFEMHGTGNKGYSEVQKARSSASKDLEMKKSVFCSEKSLI